MKLFTSYIRELFVQFLKLKPNSKSEELSRSEALRSIAPVQRPLHKGETTRGKSLVSYVLSLATIKILFCVCLAHARRRGLGTPAATGVASKNVPLLQITKRNQGKKGWEVKKWWRGVSFFRRDVKKLRRNAVTSKLSALSFSLSMILFCVCLAHARQQGLGTPVATGVALPTDSIKPLQIGDSIPSALWNLPLQMIKAGQEGSTMVTLNDYKGKLIILDFWATWCGPCVASMPKLDSLQKAFADEVAVIPSTYESSDKVSKFFHQRGWPLPSLVEENTLKMFFPYRSIPHQVWLKDNTVLAVTGPESANADNITAVLAGRAVPMRRVQPIAFDKTKPFLLNNNGGSADMMRYQSLFSKRMQLHIAGFAYSDSSVLAYNVTLGKLLYQVHAAEIGFSQKRVVWEVSDSIQQRMMLNDQKLTGDYSKDTVLLNWADSNLYCYNLVVPKPVPRAILKDMMKQDVKRFCAIYKGVSGQVENRVLKCLEISPTTKFKASKDTVPSITVTNGMKEYKRATIGTLQSALEMLFPAFQIVNAFNTEMKVDFMLPLARHDIKQMNGWLKKYGLQLRQIERELPVLVVRKLREGELI